MYKIWEYFISKQANENAGSRNREPRMEIFNTSGNDLIRRLLKQANHTTRNDVEQLMIVIKLKYTYDGNQEKACAEALKQINIPSDPKDMRAAI